MFTMDMVNQFSLSNTNLVNHTHTHTLIQVDIGGHPPSPTSPKHVSGNFGNLLLLAVFNFWGHFEDLNNFFWENEEKHGS
jgi:hypothetical protein